MGSFPGYGRIQWGRQMGNTFWFTCHHSSDLLSSKDNFWLSWAYTLSCSTWDHRIWEHMGVHTPVTAVSDTWLSEAFAIKGFFASFLLKDLLLGYISFLSFIIQHMFLWMSWLVCILGTVNSLLNAVYLAVSLGDVQSLTYIRKYSGIVQDLQFIDIVRILFCNFSL